MSAEKTNLVFLIANHAIIGAMIGGLDLEDEEGKER
jgi:hypothetical protein